MSFIISTREKSENLRCDEILKYSQQQKQVDRTVSFSRNPNVAFGMRKTAGPRVEDIVMPCPGLEDVLSEGNLSLPVSNKAHIEPLRSLRSIPSTTPPTMNDKHQDFTCSLCKVIEMQRAEVTGAREKEGGRDDHLMSTGFNSLLMFVLSLVFF